VGRYGGEEFLIILPESSSKQASVVLQRIRNKLDQVKISSPYLGKQKEISLKFSAGIAVFPHNAEDLEELIWAADNSLLRAKREGRNRSILEKRKGVRVKPLSGAIAMAVNLSGKENIEALEIVNISKEGMLLFSAQDTLLDKFSCRMPCLKNDIPFMLNCAVKHKDKLENGSYHIGVQFVDIHDDIQEKVINCIGSSEERS